MCTLVYLYASPPSQQHAGGARIYYSIVRVEVIVFIREAVADWPATEAGARRRA